MLKIKSDDEVIILAGKDKVGGKVRRVLDDNRVVVSGINMVKKHTA
jgi:large subunit ribosomal protein L24